MSKNVKISTDKVFEDFPQYGDTGWISVKSMSISVPNEITFFDIGAELDKFFGFKNNRFQFRGVISGTGVDSSCWPYQFLTQDGNTLFVCDDDGRAMLMGKPENMKSLSK